MKTNSNRQSEQDSEVLRQDLKDFKATKKSIKALIQVKKDKKASGKHESEDTVEMKDIEKKAKSAIDKLFKGKSA